MMRSVTPIIYDFKRSILRRSTILIAALAILIGLSISYGIYVFIISSIGSINDINARAYMAVIGDKLYLAGYVFNSRGEPLRNAYVTAYLGNITLIETVSSDKGLFFAEKNLASIGLSIIGNISQIPVNISQITMRIPSVEIRVGDTRINLTSTPIISETPSIPLLTSPVVYAYDGPYILTRGFGGGVYINSTNPLYTSPGIYLDFAALRRIGAMVELLVIGFRVTDKGLEPLNTEILYAVTNISSMLTSSTVTIRVSFGGSSSPTHPMSISSPESILSNLSFTVLTKSLSNYVGVYTIDLGNSRNDMYIVLATPVRDREYYIVNRYVQAHSPLYTGLVMNLSGYSSLIFFMLNLMVLFLVNSLMAKPRGSGELEFILSKPVTREDLYVFRFLAISLTVVLMVSISILAMDLFVYVLVGISYEATLLIEFALGLIGSLIAFQSLFYAVATSIRSGLYMGVSVALFIVFVLLWDSLMYAVGLALLGTRASFDELNKFVTLSTYFNPRILFRYVVDSTQSFVITSTNPVLNPALSILSWLLWLIIPFTIGLLRFKRINISS